MDGKRGRLGARAMSRQEMRKVSVNRYSQIIEKIFFWLYKEGKEALDFQREDINRVARELGIKDPKNLGDVIYSFRHRAVFPESIRTKAPAGKEWIIRSIGRAKYRFEAIATAKIAPLENLVQIKVPDATPGIIAMYALSDEQAVLAKLRYNRLLDIFTGVTCYSLQNHLRTSVKGIGQIETDEIYIGIDKRGAHYIIPIQAKGHKDKISTIQIEQDIEMCAGKFPNLLCRPVAAQFMADNLIALFEFEKQNLGIVVAMEKHYRLVPPEEIEATDLETYKKRTLD